MLAASLHGVSKTQPSRDEMEALMRRLLSEHDLPQPDEICPHEDGGLLCLWHEQKVAVVIDPGKDGAGSV
jgi:hypothetical protein